MKRKSIKTAIATSIISSVATYVYKHRREIARMLRNGLNAYLDCVPKRKKSSKKEVEKILEKFK